MSISQIESKIKSLQSEIARLNKAYTDEAKKECGYLTSASRTQKSITKNTSVLTELIFVHYLNNGGFQKCF